MIQYYLFRRNFFERYRELDENVAKPQKFSDCGKVFNDCKDAEKYNEMEEEEEEEDEDQEKMDDSPKKEGSTEKSEISDESTTQVENDEEEGAGDSQDEQPKESNSINTIRRKRTYKPIRNFIMNRRIAIEKSS